MTQPQANRHPDFEKEQAYIDYAYERLDAMRATAEMLRDSVISESSGGTHQARFQRDVFVQASLERLDQLDIGQEALCFGRIDNKDDEVFYIGRRAVVGSQQEAVVVDWRVPAAAPFYRATGRHPLDLVLRRHFSCEGKRLLDMEDERFSEEGDELGLAGTGALMGVLERARTGYMRDIVATVQAEQDEIIRADLPGVLAVQGGPGTGKTAVALHRAAYLLFTHRHQLTQKGVLFVGPNRLFLKYIDRVLPALGETGVILTTPSGLVSGIKVTGVDSPAAARIKGEARMARVVAQGVKELEKGLDKPFNLKVGRYEIRVNPRSTESVAQSARRGRGPHNRKRPTVHKLMIRRLHSQYVSAVARAGRRLGGSEGAMPRDEFELEMAESDQFWQLLDLVWPVLTPEQFVETLLTDRGLLTAAGRGFLREDEILALLRDPPNDPAHVRWTPSDVALLDEAASLLGSVDGPADPEHDDVTSYGHILVDEVQDLSPMQLRMLTRRSLHGSMTIVGDLAQATGPSAATSWDEVLGHLPERKPPTLKELSINYRTPSEIMDEAWKLLADSGLSLEPPRSVRSSGHEPGYVKAEPGGLLTSLSQVLRSELDQDPQGTIAVVSSHDQQDAVFVTLNGEGFTVGRALQDGLEHRITLLTADLVKGLEFDSMIVVEPSSIEDEAAQGARALYVVMTRATRRLTLVHENSLPGALR